MNKNLYRLVFNKARGIMMAVAETETACGKGNGGAVSNGHPVLQPAAICIGFRLKPILTAMASVLGLLSISSAHAGIMVDSTAPSTQRPTVMSAGNGVPLVNIQTPSTAGVSRNTFTQFDVSSQGLILNNSHSNVQTRQGGWVQGNPWLASGEARVILNEVNSSNPSLLHGYIEVAGSRAQVVVANPAGVSCDGCGFINANRVTLTTGTPILNGGSLDGYRVSGGIINVSGAGLDAGGADYTDIIARAVQVNAGLWGGGQLNVTTGTQQVNLDTSSNLRHLDPIAAIAGSSTPAFAVDVASLGGMYAGKIHLMGTEAGVGVRNAGNIGASAGELTLTQDGQLINTGRITSSGNANVTVTGDIGNTRTIYAQANANLATQGSIANSSVIASLGNLALTANNIDSTTGSVLAAGLKSDGTLATTGSLNATASRNLVAHGQILAGGDQSLAAASLDLTGSTTVGHQLTLLSNTGSLNAANATIAVTGVLSASTPGTLTADNASITASQINLAAQDLSNVQGAMMQTGADDMHITLHGNLDNTGGSLESMGNIGIDLGAGTLTNAGGLVISNKQLNLNAGSIDNHNTDGSRQGIQGDRVVIEADTVNNRHGAILASTTLGITGSGTLDNTQGTISSIGSLDITDRHATSTGNAADKTLDITNTGGTLVAGTAMNVDSRSLTGDGKVISQGDLTSKLLQNYANTGAWQAGGNGVFLTPGTLTNQATMSAGQTLDITAGTIDNRAAGVFTGATTLITATDTHTLTNRGLIDGGNTFINAITLNNIGTGRIYGDHIAIAATSLTNDTETVNGTTSAGTIAARSQLDVGAATIVNREHALLFSAGDMAIGGALDANHQATGQATSLSNNSATIEALGNLTISAATLLNANLHFATGISLTSQTTFTGYDMGEWCSSLYSMPGCIGNFYEDHTEHTYTQSVYTPVVTQSDPGKIMSGGNIMLTGNTITNDKSQIVAGGTLSGSLANLTNIGVQGTQQNVLRDDYKVWMGGGDDYYRDINTNIITTNATVTLPVATADHNTAPAGSGTQLGSRTGAATGTTGPLNTTGVSTTPGTSPALTLPGSSLFQINPSPNSHYLIATDPRFADYRTWISSDYMLTQLGLDPATTQKRLGDGFYEQKLLREQVAELTGRRFLSGYASDEAEYQALMSAGVTYAKSQHLAPGVALTDVQIAQLTTDIVWLIDQPVTLADGLVQHVLVPHVYLRPQTGDLQPTGALIAADSLDLHLTGDLANSNGTLLGRQVMTITADNVKNLNGRLAANNVQITAAQDILDQGGVIAGADALSVHAGRNLTVETTTATADNATANSDVSRTKVDRVAGLYVSNPSGTLIASAGNNLNLIAAAILNSRANGTTTLSAGRDLNLGTVTTAERNQRTWDARNHADLEASAEVGSTIQTQGDLALVANRDITAKAASVTSDQGTLTAVASRDLTITTGVATRNEDTGRYGKKSGAFSSTSKASHDTLNETTALSSTFSGDKVDLSAGRDLTVHGSNVVSTHGTTLDAKDNVTIDAATETRDETHAYQKSKSGVFASGGTLALGQQRRLATTTDTQTVTHLGSTIGSTDGNVRITAGKDYTQTGSNVLALKGDVDISAQKVDINAATDTTARQQTMKFSQSGLSVSVSNPVISVVQTGTQMATAASQTSDSRMQVLAAATTALAVKNAADAVAANPRQVGGINLSASLGSSKSSSQSTQTTSTAVGSQVIAGSDVTITATGAGKESNLNVVGSTVKAGNDVTFIADNQVNLLAAQNVATENSSNKSSSGSIGVGYNTSTGFGFTVSASGGKGRAHGTDVTYTNTVVSAGNTLDLESGGDANLKGATASGKQVIADIGGNLNIESLQDTSTYNSKQGSVGGSLTVGTGMVSGSLNVSGSRINSDYASVTEQSGIKAGDGGFDITVKGNTDLKGAVIESTQAAIDSNKNSFTTGTLTTSDIENKAEYTADSVSLGVGYSTSGNGIGKDSQGKATTGGNVTPGSTLSSLNGFSATAPVALSAGDEASSTTKSGISGADIHITNDTKQQTTTGKDAATTVATLNRDVATGKDTINALGKIFTDETKQNINAGFEIVGAFSGQASTFLDNRAKESTAAQQALDAENAKPADQRNQDVITQATQILQDNQIWAMGGTGRIALTAVTAAFSGNLTGSGTELVQSAAIHTLQALGAQEIKQLADSLGGEGSAAHTALHALLGCAGATATGGDCGTGALSASAGVVINALLDQIDGKTGANLSPEEKEARVNLINTIIIGTTAALGGDAATASVAARIETENNALTGKDLMSYASYTVFASRHPIAAIEIGWDQDPKKVKDPNISTIASTFQLNLLGDKDGPNGAYEGGPSNAFRHVIWQAMITSTFDEDTAIAAGLAHDPLFPTSTPSGNYANLNQADTACDLSNNEIGRQIALQNTGLSNIQFARKILDQQHQEGFYQAVQQSDGSFNVEKVKLSDMDYQIAIKAITIKKLDNTGAGANIRATRSRLP